MTHRPISDTYDAASALAGRTLLLVEDDPGVVAALKLLLTNAGAEVRAVGTLEDAETAFAATHPDAVLLDLNLTVGARSGEDGLHLLHRFIETDPTAVVVVLTAHSGIAIAVEAMKAGATDFVMKPWSNRRLIDVLHTAIRGRPDITGSRSKEPTYPIVGGSASVRRARSTLLKATATQANVLIIGEAGTGKDHVARAIHRHSNVHQSQLVALAFGKASTPDWRAVLMEAEARSIAQAGPTTVLISGIDHLLPADQIDLARRMAEQRSFRAGSDALFPRIIATSETSRARLHATSQFNAGLLAQVATIELALDPLRRRPEDVGPLLRYFLQQHADSLSRAPQSVDADTVTALENLVWPQNIDTLKALAERATLASESNILSLSDFGILTTSTQSEDLNLEKSEKRLLERALSKHRYNVTLAARDLGLTRAALYRRMDRHGL